MKLNSKIRLEIKAKIKAQGYKICELSQMMGYASSTLSSLLCNGKKMPVEMADSLNKYLGTNYQGSDGKRYNTDTEFGRLRKSKSMSLLEFAKAIGVSQNTASMIELGRTPITDNVSEKIKNAFGVTILPYIREKKEKEVVERKGRMKFFTKTELGRYRKSKNISITELAKIIGVSVSTLNYIEKGKRKADEKIANKIEKITGIKLPKDMIHNKKYTKDLVSVNLDDIKPEVPFSKKKHKSSDRVFIEIDDNFYVTNERNLLKSKRIKIPVLKHEIDFMMKKHAKKNPKILK